MKTPIEPYHYAKRSQSMRLTAPFQQLRPPLLIMLTVFLLTGCGTLVQGVKLPPVVETPAAGIQEGHFVWIDLLTEDVVAAASFYSRLFGWRAAQSKENGEYYLFSVGGKPVAGMTATESRDAQAPESLWLITVSVKDMDTRVAAAKTLGGTVLEGPLDAEGRGTMALISDRGGAPLILLEAGGEPQAIDKANPGQWFWTDLVTQDARRAQTFYTALFGYRAKPVKDSDAGDHVILGRDGRAAAGLVELQWEGLEDNWLPYFKVADLNQSIQTARTLGGTLIFQSGDVAVLADPIGAVFGIQGS